MPVAGNPFNTTVPVDKVHVGCIIVPTVGADGDAGCAGITTLPDDGDIHPAELVTVYVYVPSDRFEIVILVPDPVVVTPPGERINVHVPVPGKPLKTTLPVGTEHVGWVIAPTTGADGMAFTVNV